MTTSARSTRTPFLRTARGALVAALVASTLMAGKSLVTRQVVNQLASQAPGGQAANDVSQDPTASFNGRFVAFVSAADNLVDGDTNGAKDVFVRDRRKDLVRRVSVASDGAQANDDCSEPRVSGNGRFVTYTSQASNLVAGDTNGDADVFVHDLRKGTTERVSVDAGGQQADGASFNAEISSSGRFVAFTSFAALVADDTNGRMDCYVHDRRKGTTTRVSVDSDGAQTDRGIERSPIHLSANGRFITFDGLGDDLSAEDGNGQGDVYLHDRKKGTTVLVSLGDVGQQGTSFSTTGSVSNSGRFVAFHTNNSLVDGDTNGRRDIFVRDRKRGRTTLVSVSSDGQQGDGNSFGARLSANGRFVVFQSSASNLVEGDTNGVTDVFLHDLKSGRTVCLSVDADGVPRGGQDGMPTAAGRYATFHSSAALTDGDDNGLQDVFLSQPGKRRK